MPPVTWSFEEEVDIMLAIINRTQTRRVVAFIERARQVAPPHVGERYLRAAEHFGNSRVICACEHLHDARACKHDCHSSR